MTGGQPPVKGHTKGPVFLTSRKARVQLAPDGIDPAGGKARPSYRRAAEIFEQATRALANPGITEAVELETKHGSTLHQLRHRALTHAADDGANTAPPCRPTPSAASVTSLVRYARVSPEALGRRQAAAPPTGAADPAGTRPSARTRSRWLNTPRASLSVIGSLR